MDFQPSGCPESGKKCTQSHGACVGSQPGAPDRHPPSPELSASDASIAMARTASATSPDAQETGLGQRPLSCWSPAPKSAFHAE